MSKQYPNYNPKFKASPEIQEIYHEWFYAGGAERKWSEEHPFMEWLQDHYPDIYKSHYEQFYAHGE
jgi:hypothetical protein